MEAHEKKLKGRDMHYAEPSERNECIYIAVSDRAYRAITKEVVDHGKNETGGILLGNFDKGIWYVVECVDPGLDEKTIHKTGLFRFDEKYLNHLKNKISVLYKYPLTILGVWHRHPGSMDTFSGTDMDSMADLVNDARVGILSMLVNIDPAQRLTFYFCNKKGEVVNTPYDVGDEYFPPEMLSYAPPEEVIRGGGGSYVPEKKEVFFPAKDLPGSMANLRATREKALSEAEKERIAEPEKQPSGKNTHPREKITHGVMYKGLHLELISRLYKRHPTRSEPQVLFGYTEGRRAYAAAAIPMRQCMRRTGKRFILSEEILEKRRDGLSANFVFPIQTVGLWATHRQRTAGPTREEIEKCAALAQLSGSEQLLVLCLDDQLKSGVSVPLTVAYAVNQNGAYKPVSFEFGTLKFLRLKRRRGLTLMNALVFGQSKQHIRREAQQ